MAPYDIISTRYSTASFIRLMQPIITLGVMPWEPCCDVTNSCVVL